MLYTEDGKDRYPYFKLYKMIAKTVHNHVPKNEIENELFHPFILTDTKNTVFKTIKKEDTFMDIDIIPDYSQIK